MSAPAGRRPFCAEVSSAGDEPLAATASRIDHWLLIEYRGAWSRDVLGGSALSEEVKTHLREQLAALARSRLLFVKRPERRAYSDRRVYVARSTPGAERLVGHAVDDLEDLAELDLVALLSDPPLDDPLFVVCTHGKRDRCCARYGGPLYDALRSEAEPSCVWQSTHVGGDRFAGNVVVLPHGLYYGRVAPGDSGALLAAHAEGRIDLERYRGRSTFSFAVQAAERAIRDAQGLLGIADLAFRGSQRLDAGTLRARFATRDGSVHEADVVPTQTPEPVYLTCDAAEPQYARRYEIAALRVLSP